MSPEGTLKLKKLLIQHEAYKQFPYTDTTGHVTIGIGRNLTDRGISIIEANMLLEEDISYFTDKLTRYIPLFYKLSENRKIALVDMCFNLGLRGFLSFKKMIAALESGDYQRAAKEMLDSKWATQVGLRASRLASIIQSGDL